MGVPVRWHLKPLLGRRLHNRNLYKTGLQIVICAAQDGAGVGVVWCHGVSRELLIRRLNDRLPYNTLADGGKL